MTQTADVLTRELVQELRLCGSSTAAEFDALCALALKGLDAGEGKPDGAVEALERAILAWVREDVLPAFGISPEAAQADAELIEGLRAALATLKGDTA